MNINVDVDRFLAEKEHPLTEEIQRVREIILAVASQVYRVIMQLMNYSRIIKNGFNH